jgi:hypothetical protein
MSDELPQVWKQIVELQREPAAFWQSRSSFGKKCDV